MRFLPQLYKALNTETKREKLEREIERAIKKNKKHKHKGHK